MKKTVSVNDLRIGYSIADDIKAGDGRTLVAKGVVLNEKHLKRLRQWFANSDFMFTIDDGETQVVTDDISKKVAMEKLQSVTIDCIDKVFNVTGKELDEALQIMNYSVFSICEDLKSVSDLPDDVIRIMYHNKSGSHYFRVTRMAVALASIYNKDKSENMQIPLPSICLSALLYDYGRRYKNDLKGLQDLSFNSTTLKGTTIVPAAIDSSYDDSLHSVYSYVALKGKVPEDVRKTILYCNYKDFSSSGSLRPEVKAANIISLSDIYDKLLERTMQLDLSSPFENVISYIEQLAYNGEIDCDIYQLFLHHIPIYPQGVKVLLSNGQEAFVVGESREFPTRPSVLVFNNGRTDIINLSETTNITIRRVLQEEETTDDRVNVIQSEQLQSSNVSIDRDMFVPPDDDPTLELQNEKFAQPKTLDKKLKAFFRRK